MTKEKLTEILEQHKLWLNDEGGSRANLSEANLSGANLSGANLSGANLSGADGLLSTVNFLEAHFERTPDGYIAYKTFNSEYNAPDTWKIEAVLSLRRL